MYVLKVHGAIFFSCNFRSFFFCCRLACQVNDGQTLPGTPPAVISPGEALSKRCVPIIKTALKREIWPSEWLA